MEVQSKLLKIFFIVSVIHTLTFGASMERHACSTDDAMTALDSIRDTLCLNTTQLSCEIDLGLSEINMADVDDYLEPVLKLQNGALKQAVDMCINSTDLDPCSCELATAAIRLQATIVNFVTKYSGSGAEFNHNINCTTQPQKDTDMKQTLCWASSYTKKVLDLAS